MIRDRLKFIRNEDDAFKESLILKIIIAGAFSPNYFRLKNVDENTALKDVAGKDLRSTVIVKI